MSESLALERSALRISWFDRLLISVAPEWGMRRVRARATAQLMTRHFEAASFGRRTDGWSRRNTDANAAAAGPSLALLRAQARDLVRNNPWARRGLRRIVTNTVGWGIRPKATGAGASRVMDLWKQWGETTDCDAAGRLTFYGLQRLAMRTIVESGEVIIRRRMRLRSDGFAVPMQLQVLEPDHIDTGRNGFIPGIQQGNKVLQGIEFDPIGRRVAYWLFDQHPGGLFVTNAISRRVPAEGVLHIYDQDRAGQVRGPSWFASVDIRLHDFDEFEDATLMKQKIAACLAAFVTDVEGDLPTLGPGAAGADRRTGLPVDAFEPGMIVGLPPGKQVTVANPPTASDHQSYSATSLRGVAAGLGTTYEELTGDYSQVNYSSARMGRNAHMGDVHDWRWNMLIPQFCVPAWEWMVNALILAGEPVEDSPATWTPAPLPMLDPDKEASATTKAVRAGQMTLDEMVREQGYDPDDYWKEYSDGLKRLDKYGIVLDSDPRKTSGQGQLQASPAIAPTAPTAPTKPADSSSTAEAEGDAETLDASDAP